jgi:hypothetical protein
MAKAPSRPLRVATIALTAALAVGAGNFMTASAEDPSVEPLRQQAGFLAAAKGTAQVVTPLRAPASVTPAAAAEAPPAAKVPPVDATAAMAKPPAAIPPAPAEGAPGAAAMVALEAPAMPRPPAAAEAPVVRPVADSAEVAAPEDGAVAAEAPSLLADGATACPTSLKVTAVPGGMAYLAFDAPCQRGRPVALGHAGLVADVAVPASGRLAQLLPVLDPAAPFVVTLQDGDEAEARLAQAPNSDIAHVVLQYEGAAGLALHALEFGAAPGEAGHVWSGAAREALHAIRGEGGFLTRIGDAGLGAVAEVYSVPAGNMARTGEVELMVEAEVTAATCGRDLQAQVLRRGLGGAPEVVALKIALPGCDAVGHILQLKNLVQDLKIAAN